jgi:glycosyltransferase involved in cell wall biosynthesis
MDLWPESLQASGLGAPIQRWTRLQQWLDKWLSMTYEVADSIACTSRRQIELLAQRGVPLSKLSYVPVWVDETILYPVGRDEVLAASLGVAGKTVLLYAGAIGDPQGLEPLIKVCAGLRDEPRFHCLIAGTGNAAARLRRQANDQRLTNVSFLGQWPADDMTRLMSVGDIHLVSLRSDPLAEVAMPSKVPATMACAKPLIVAALGDAASVVTRSGAGWACRPGNAAELEGAVRSALAAGQPVLEAMGRRGRQFYELEFGLGVGVDRVEQLLAGGSLRGKDVA